MIYLDGPYYRPTLRYKLEQLFLDAMSALMFITEMWVWLMSIPVRLMWPVKWIVAALLTFLFFTSI